MGLNTKQVSDDCLELNWTPPISGSDGLELPAKRQLQSPPSDPLECPRCESTNTKFCYYNNYNKTQPRHFCRACKRHWTKGGTLRNVPVGGGRKNKRLRRPAAATATTPTLNPSYMGFSDQKASFSKPIGHDIKGQVSWDFNGNFTSYEPQLSHQIHQDLGFSAAERNPNPVSSPLNGYNEDSTITTRMVVESCSSSQPWQVLPSTSNFLESNYWNWNDIETMVLADLNKPFEDPQFKP